MDIAEIIDNIREQGYDQFHATARLCQDIVMKALAQSTLRRSVTIKGGVVMRSISHDIRRATRDLDIDFIRYSLDDASIDSFIGKLNCIEGIDISRIGEIEELKQEDYHGKRVHIQIRDEHGNSINSKIDLGVHKNLSIEQEEYCFDVFVDEDGASLLVNSKEQMYTEKLRSLLKFGAFSTRYKDVFDIYFLCDLVDKVRLLRCFKEYIFNDQGMKENTMQDILRRVHKTFCNSAYRDKLASTEVNWLNADMSVVLSTIESFLGKMVKYAEN